MIADRQDNVTDVEPSPTVDNGRTKRGTFAKGNKVARGNPRAKHVNELRSVLLEIGTPDRMRRVVTALFDAAEGGDVSAQREVLDRYFGKSAQPVVHEGGTDNRLTVEVTYRHPDKPQFDSANARN
jgi:hypothetical protein